MQLTSALLLLAWLINWNQSWLEKKFKMETTTIHIIAIMMRQLFICKRTSNTITNIHLLVDKNQSFHLITTFSTTFTTNFIFTFITTYITSFITTFIPTILTTIFIFYFANFKSFWFLLRIHYLYKSPMMNLPTHSRWKDDIKPIRSFTMKNLIFVQFYRLSPWPDMWSVLLLSLPRDTIRPSCQWTN